MVNLPAAEQGDRAVGERYSERPVRSHHNWGARFGRRRHQPGLRAEPASLLRLEELAARTVELMEKHGPPSDHNFTMAMDLLRLQYNLNFMMLCEKCCGPHAHDELIAPER